MGDQRQIRRSWNRMPTKRCTANGNMEEFIVVDDDEVIILDFPDSSKAKASGTSRTRNDSILQRVISIDDDDDEIENVHNSGSSSSSSNNPPAANLQTSAEVDNDDCQFIQENFASFKFSKCKQTSSTLPLPGFRFGLGSDTENELSESDCSDCEILDGSQREVREQWEKAFSRKMKKVGKAGVNEQAGPSSLHCDTDFSTRFESRTEQRDQRPFVFAARNPDDGKETSATFFGTDNRNPDIEDNEKAYSRKMKKVGKAGVNEQTGPSSLHCDTDFSARFESRTEQRDQTPFVFAARNLDGGKETSATFFGTDNRNPDIEDNEKAYSRKMKKVGKAGVSEQAGPSSLHCDTDFRTGFESRTEQHDQTPFVFAARNPDGGKETSATFFGTDNRNPDIEENGKAKNCATSSFCNKEDFPGPSLLSPKIRVEHKRFDTPLSHFTSPKEPMHETSFGIVEEQSNRVQDQCETSESPEKHQKKKAAYETNTKEVEEEEDVSKSSLPQTSDGDRDTRVPIIDPIPSTSGRVQGINGTAPAIDVMLNREMLKETDDYKKAQEEEWESRQRQLQIQAEEAQRQRKRRKLETMRQLEVERRQKERVEEVRETQKKDEESMNMKEKVRSEITKSLKQLERTSFNMASLLRGLGIHVNGGISPLPQDVHAAYKRALLRFHPDRSSRDDIRQQVEAEEKFKLISRMKDKLLFTSPFC